MPQVSSNTLALQKSLGFIPQGFDLLPKEVFRNLFFSTSSGDSYRQPSQMAGKAIVLNCRSRSMQDIHDANALAKNYKRPEAPLWQRTMCEYTQQYPSRPLDGVEVNRALYHLFKQQQEDCATKPAPGTKLASATTAASSYTEIPRDAAVKAIPESFKPKQVLHVDPENHLLITTSTEHKSFRAPTAKQVSAARPESFKPKSQSHAAGAPFYARSSYEREYYASKYKESWPDRFTRQPRAPPPCEGYTGHVKAETEDGPQVLDQFHIGDLMKHSHF